MRVRHVFIAAAAAPLAPLGAIHAQPAQDNQSCFARSNVDNFVAPDDRTVYVRVGVTDVYRLDLMSDCANLSWRNAIGFKTTPGSPVDLLAAGRG